jgi:hypothetical protein
VTALLLSSLFGIPHASAVSISHATKSKAVTFSFFTTHRTSSSEEIRRVVIDANNRLLSTTLLTSAGQMDISVEDARDGFILIDNNAESGDALYLQSPDGSNRHLGVYKQTNPAITTSLNYVHLGTKGNFLYGIDYSGDLYKVDLESNTPNFSQLMSSLEFQNAIAQSGGVSRDWIEDFGMINDNNLIVLTTNTESSQVKLWRVTLGSSLSATELFSAVSPNLLATTYMAMSPKRDQVALMYAASSLTPVDALKIFNLNSNAVTSISARRLNASGNYFLTWLDESNLLMTTTNLWKSDEIGGRVVCRLNLAQSSPCTDIPGLASYSLAGNI